MAEDDSRLKELFGDSEDENEDNVDLKNLSEEEEALDNNEVVSDHQDEEYGIDPGQLPSFKKKKASGASESKKSKSKEKKRRKRPRDDDSQEANPEDKPAAPLDPEMAKKLEVKRDIEEALQRIKPKRMKKRDLQDEAEIDEMMAALVSKMKEAAEKDHDFNKLKQPAIAKLKLLPSVMELLTRSHLWDQFLDNHILEAIKMWLEPLTDGSLPALDIQKSMMRALSEMPIRTEHLRESGVGRVVMFYSKCDRVIPDIQKTVQDLLNKWMRPIMKRSDNYRDRVVHERDYNPRRDSYDDIASTNSSGTRGDIQDGDRRRVEAAPRVRIPAPVSAAFDFAPKSHVISGESKKMPDKFRKLETKLKKRK